MKETPEALERWLTEHFLPENGLLGFESAGRRREAELGAEFAHARTESLAKPARSATLTTQATQGLRGGAFALTFALSVALDPPREALQITQAAEREGAARGRLSSLERELDEQRARAQQRLGEANALLDAETSIQQRLNALEEALRAKQAATPDVHDALKQRQLAQLQAARLESEKRRLEAHEQRRSALFRGLALGTQPAAARAQPRRSPAAEDHARALIEQQPDVTVADAAAGAARDHQPVPVASALHLVGPFALGSYAANRITGPTTTKIWRGDLGVGLALGLDEALARSLRTSSRPRSDRERGAARQDAALQAIHELTLTCTMRELERLSAQEAAETLHHLEASVQPRFGLGQVTAATVMDAQQRYAFARLRHSSDESLLRAQRALLAALGAELSDAALDEYQRRASAWLASGPGTTTAPSPSPSSAELAAQSRSRAASTATAGSALRLASPITGLVEFRPAQLEITTGTDDAREASTSHELLWVFSLIVPFKPKEFGSLSVASARARESDEELGAASRSARLRRLGLQARLAACRREQASAKARTLAAERALTELERRFHTAQDDTSIDELAPARQALFDARRAEVIASGATLEAALAQRALQENR